MTIVVKIGGSIADADHALRDIASRSGPMVVVHGASRELNELSSQLGSPPRIVESERGEVSRYTDTATMDRFLMAYAGKANKRVVERLRQLGVDALGLSGLDGGIVRGHRRPDLRIRENGKTLVLHDNHVGTIEVVNTALLLLLLAGGYTPVLTPPIAADDGTALNVDGDRMAAEIAVALSAEALVVLSNTPGLLRDVDDDATTIARVAPDEVDTLLPLLGGRARSKLRAAASARQHGVRSVAIADGRIVRPVTSALAGAGTWLLG